MQRLNLVLVRVKERTLTPGLETIPSVCSVKGMLKRPPLDTGISNPVVYLKAVAGDETGSDSIRSPSREASLQRLVPSG